MGLCRSALITQPVIEHPWSDASAQFQPAFEKVPTSWKEVCQCVLSIALLLAARALGLARVQLQGWLEASDLHLQDQLPASTSRRCWSDLPFTTRKVKSSINRSTWRFEPRKDPLMDVSTSRPMWRWPNFSMLTTNSQRKEAVNPSKACSGELRDAMGQRVE